jgi:nucleoside-diphosphate-sugar epimerase
MRTYLANFVPLMTSGNQYVDVRDVAQVHLMLLEQAPPPGRYLLGGHYIPWMKLASVLEPITGRKLLKLPLHGGAMRLAGKVFDRLSPVFNLDIPVTEEGMVYATNWVKMDNSKVERELDFEFRPIEDSSGAHHSRAGGQGSGCLSGLRQVPSGGAEAPGNVKIIQKG